MWGDEWSPLWHHFKKIVPTIIIIIIIIMPHESEHNNGTLVQFISLMTQSKYAVLSENPFLNHQSLKILSTVCPLNWFE